MRLTRKKVGEVSAILSVILFYLGVIFFIVALTIINLEITNLVYFLYMLTLTSGIVATVGCAICTYLAIGWRKTKVFRETYFYAVFVPLFCILGYILLKLGLKINFPITWLILISIASGTLLSCAFAGYPKKKTWTKLRRLGLTQGINIITLILLGLIPLIEVLPQFTTLAIVRSSGTIYFPVFLESGNDITRLQGQVSSSVFIAEVPVPSDTIFVANQVMNVTNQDSKSHELTIYLEDFSGNLSRVNQFEIFFTLENGSEIRPFSIDNGNVKYEENHIEIKSHTTISMGVISSAQNEPSIDTCVVSLLIRLNKDNLGMNISFTHT